MQEEKKQTNKKNLTNYKLFKFKFADKCCTFFISSFSIFFSPKGKYQSGTWALVIKVVADGKKLFLCWEILVWMDFSLLPKTVNIQGGGVSCRQNYTHIALSIMVLVEKERSTGVKLYL